MEKIHHAEHNRVFLAFLVRIYSDIFLLVLDGFSLLYAATYAP